MLLRNQLTTIIIVLSVTVSCAARYARDEAPFESAKGKKAATKPAGPASIFKKRPRRTAKTPQERREQSILQTFDELIGIAEGLAKFTGSKEAQEAITTKKQTRERLEKDAAQRLKRAQEQRGRSGSSSRSSDGGYRGSGGQAPGKGGYGGYGGGWGPSSWGGRTPSSSSSSVSPSKKHDFGFDDDDFGFEDDKKLKTDDKKKDKGGGGTTLGETRKEQETAYTRAVSNAQKAAETVQKAMSGLTGSPEEIAKDLLERNQFSEISKALEQITDPRTEFKGNEFANFDKANKGQFQQAESRLNSALAQLWPLALHAATLTEREGFDAADTDHTGAQTASLNLLKTEVMKKFSNDAKIDQRAAKMLAETPAAATYGPQKTALETQQGVVHRALPGAAAPWGAGKQLAIDAFTARKTQLTNLLAKLPKGKKPKSLMNQINEANRLIKEANAIP